MSNIYGSSAKLAISHFRELERFSYKPKQQKKEHEFSLVHCKLGTGRTHQIRVHCHHQKMPIINDRKYFIDSFMKYEQELFSEIAGFDEMHFLHAYSLEFRHPTKDKICRFTAQPPLMFTKVLGRLRTLCLMADHQ